MTTFEDLKWKKVVLYYADKKYRYVLGKYEKNPLICIGLNPSTATPEKSDRTYSRVKKIAEYNDFDGVILLNLYPEISTKPDELSENKNKTAYDKNLEIIKNILDELPKAPVWYAWGDKISKRQYLKDSAKEIKRLISSHNILSAGDTENGNPLHPLHLKNETKLK